MTHLAVIEPDPDHPGEVVLVVTQVMMPAGFAPPWADVQELEDIASIGTIGAVGQPEPHPAWDEALHRVGYVPVAGRPWSRGEWDDEGGYGYWAREVAPAHST